MMMPSHLKLLRPHQWLKNLLLLFPPFLAGEIFRPGFVLQGIAPLVAFCLASSGIYILNDLCDLEQDRQHPRKKLRPIASGEVSSANARLLVMVLCLAGLIAGYLVSPVFLVLLLTYLVISFGYSLKLKEIPLVEIFCVVSGFLLRLASGGEAFSIVISDWLFLSVFLLALYLVCGKRLSELRYEGEGSAEKTRPVLSYYPSGFLEGGMFISGAAVLVTYSMYVLEHRALVYTVPLCCFGLLAYLLRVLTGRGGDPTRALLKDPVIFIVGLVWVLITGFSLYGEIL